MGLVADFLQPGGDVVSSFRDVLFADGKAVLDDGGVWLQLLDRLDGAGEAAAVVDVEGDDGLAGEVILVKEAVHRHRQVGPPVRVADKDGVVLVQVLDVRGQLGAGVFVLLLRGVVDQLTAVGRIDHRGSDGEQVAAGVLLNHVRDGAQAADRFTVDGAVAGRGDRVHAAVFHRSKVGDQDVGAAALLTGSSLIGAFFCAGGRFLGRLTAGFRGGLGGGVSFFAGLGGGVGLLAGVGGGGSFFLLAGAFRRRCGAGAAGSGGLRIVAAAAGGTGKGQRGGQQDGQDVFLETNHDLKLLSLKKATVVGIAAEVFRLCGSCPCW